MAKVAYVTGGMGGIGTAICQRLKRRLHVLRAGRQRGRTGKHARRIQKATAEEGPTKYWSITLASRATT
jgi:NAD(P)-dependent dehydrogenase (short-subunit alcohol dehydrogenase family)